MLTPLTVYWAFTGDILTMMIIGAAAGLVYDSIASKVFYGLSWTKAILLNFACTVTIIGLVNGLFEKLLAPIIVKALQ